MNNKNITKNLLTISNLLAIVVMSVTSVYSQTLWDQAKKNKDVLTVTTLFTAQNVRDFLTDAEGLNNAVNWCKQTGITKVYIETFRGGYYADRATLVSAKKRFLNEGFVVSGCVTTVRLGKDGIGGWNNTPCFTNKESQEELQRIFEYTASIFDEIMIDDFLFIECECEECVAARGDQEWSMYYSDLMVKMSQDRILKPSRAVNPNVKVIIKYPCWYDDFHRRGYEVVRESRDYDITYVGTETRDYNYDIRPRGGYVQYSAYFIMRWLGGIGGDKTLGGWFDGLGTTPVTYREQARQTVLADAKELMLFSYGGLINETNLYGGWFGTGIANVDGFRKELPGLFELAKLVRGKSIKGIHLPKLPNSEPFEEPYVFSLLGMLGLPLVPAHEINEQASSAVFSVHMLKAPGFSNTLQRMLDKGTPVVITDGLAKRLTSQELLKRDNLSVLKVAGEPKNLLKLTQEELKPIRDKLLAPTGMKFDAPNKVGLYLYGDDCFVVENFNDQKVNVRLSFSKVSEAQKVLILPESGNVDLTVDNNSVIMQNLTPRTLIAVKYR